jgi:hypothetical protein
MFIRSLAANSIGGARRGGDEKSARQTTIIFGKPVDSSNSPSPSLVVRSFFVHRLPADRYTEQEGFPIGAQPVARTSAAKRVVDVEGEEELAKEKKWTRRERAEAVVELCDCVIDLTSALFGVCGREMREPGRTRLEVARVRQVAMYVAHTGLGLSMAEVGRGFGRDRTTVLHAVHLVEDLREDPESEALVARAEHLVRVAIRGRAVWSLRP